MHATHDRAKEIFLQATEITSPEERSALLDRECGGDDALRQEIEDLLRHEQSLGSFLEHPAIVVNDTVDHEPAILERPGEMIGPYKLLEQIGEGGFGVVFMAEQERPVRRRVALKIIKPGMDTRQVIARFEAERQALAMMDHPGIAKVFDAGATDTGRPYFVMELVKGVPITAYCDLHKLSPRERLELFIPVCQAVQHAHQKGIIHRDIKPSNVLVARYDNKPVPKIIDFGVAKAIEQHLTEKTVFTEFGQVVGTVEYMSPEQAQFNQLDIDTRTDIYSLGVLLYELLVGETPFDRGRLRSAAFDEVLRIIREEDPPRPSLRLSTSDSRASIAANRHLEPKRLSTLVHGELDWIVMKALEKERSRRYETASKFAEDVEHYLRDEAVAACPPSASYRFGKFARRNKAMLATAAVILLTLVAGALGTTWQALRATYAEKAARLSLAAEKKAHAQTTIAREAEATHRKLAEASEHAAEQARAEAQANSEERLKSLVRQYVREGTDYVEAGDYTMALPWFLKALELDEENTHRASIHRLRIATTLDRCPKLTQVWFPGHEIKTIDFLPDGQHVLLSGGSRAVVWNIGSSDPPVLELASRFVQLSPDKRRILHISGSGEVALLDSRTGKLILKLPTEECDPRFARFSSDGSRILVVYGEVLARVWDSSTGTPTTPILNGDLHRICGAQFTPNGRYLVVADDHPTWPDQLLVWDLVSAEIVRKIAIRDGFESQSYVDSLVVTNDLVAVLTDVFVHVASLADGRLKYPLLRHADGVARLSLSPDGSTFLSCSPDRSARMWSVSSGEQFTGPLTHDAPVFVATFSDDGEKIVTASSDGEIKMWNGRTGEKIGSVLRHPDKITAAKFNPSGQLLITASRQGGVRVWDLAAGLFAPAMTRRYGGWAMGTEFSPDGQILGVSCLDHFVRLYDRDTGKLVMRPLQHTYFADFCSYSDDGKQFLTSSADGTLALRQAKDGKPVFQNSLLRRQGGMLNDRGETFSKSHIRAWIDSSTKRIYAHTHHTLYVLDEKSGELLVKPIELERWIQHSQLLADKECWIGCIGDRHDFNGCRIEIRELPGMKLRRTFSLEMTPSSAQISRDGKRLLIAAGKFREGTGYAQILDFATGDPLTPRMRHQEAVFDARFLTDDRFILTSSLDGVVRVWSSDGSSLAAPEMRLGRWARSLAISPDEQWMAVGTGGNNARGVAEQYLRLWDFWNGEPISPAEPHGNTIMSVSFSPDGRQLVTTSRDYCLRVWDVPGETRPERDLASLIQLISGVELDESDTLTIIDGGRIRSLWTNLREKYPGDFVTSTAEQIAWHRSRALHHASQEQFTKAVEELNQLIELDPNDPELFLRRIRFNKYLHWWDSMPSDAQHVIQLEFREGADLAELALLVGSGPETPQEVKDFALGLANQAVLQAPEEAHTYLARGRLYCNWRRWSEAEADFAKTVELEPGNYRPWYELALVQVAQKKQQDYRATCRRMIKAIPATNAPQAEQFIAWTCCLDEGSLSNLAEITDHRQWARAQNSASLAYRGTYGMVLLRAGAFDSALDELSEANMLLNNPSSSLGHSPAYIWYGLAFTCHRLKLANEAKTWLEKANAWSDQAMNSPHNSVANVLPWNRRLTLELLRKEAEALIGQEEPEPKPKEPGETDTNLKE